MCVYKYLNLPLIWHKRQIPYEWMNEWTNEWKFAYKLCIIYMKANYIRVLKTLKNEVNYENIVVWKSSVIRWRRSTVF